MLALRDVRHAQNRFALSRVEAARFLLVLRQVFRRPEATAAPVTDVADSGPRAVQSATLAAEEGRHIVDEDVVRVQAKQMHLMLRLRPAVGRLAHQMALEVALAGHLLATPVPHVDVDEAAVGPLKLRDVGPTHTPLARIRQRGPVQTEVLQLALRLLAVLAPSWRYAVEDLVREPGRGLRPLARQLVHLRQVGPDAPGKAGEVLSARVPEALLRHKLFGQGVRVRSSHLQIFAEDGRGRKLRHLHARTHQHVDVLDATDHLSGVAQPRGFQVLLELQPGRFHDVPHAAVWIAVGRHEPRRGLQQVVILNPLGSHAGLNGSPTG